ncbi:MAG: ATP-binding protein, partial [Wenzhouxiangellaceae bacterium]|nr:ATP-binding protein [Wenzhouxiangellaceae bacterium]
PDRELVWQGNLGDSALGVPQSGLYAGARTPSDRWLSPSTVGLGSEVPPVDVPRGTQRQEAPSEGQPLYVRRLGLGWELPSGEIVDLTVWAAEHRSRFDRSRARFRSDLWGWLAIAAVILVVAQMLLLAQPLAVLRRVANEVRRVESGRRSTLGGTWPRELRPLTDNLDALLRTERANAEQYQQALEDLAHSLKTPLAVLNAQVEARETPDREEIRELVDQMRRRIRAELDRASRSGRMTMLPPLAVAPSTRRLVNSIRKLYPGTTIDVEIAPEDLEVNVAERDLVELLGNLLENAAKYGGGRIALRLVAGSTALRRTGLLVEVEDDGPGLEPERFEALLERGVRGDERAEGQGFGLSIVAGIVDSYHGQIRADRSQWGGLRIRVELRPS